MNMTASSFQEKLQNIENKLLDVEKDTEEERFLLTELIKTQNEYLKLLN